MTIGEKAFENNENVTKVTIPGSVSEIKWDAFKGCRELQEVVFEKGTKLTIRGDAFSFCPKLAEFTVPAHADYIVANIFKGDKSLKNIKVDAENKKYHEKDGVLFGPVAKDNEPDVFDSGCTQIAGISFRKTGRICDSRYS